MLSKLAIYILLPMLISHVNTNTKYVNDMQCYHVYNWNQQACKINYIYGKFKITKKNRDI